MEKQKESNIRFLPDSCVIAAERISLQLSEVLIHTLKKIPTKTVKKEKGDQNKS